MIEPGLRLTPSGHLLLEAGEGRLEAAFAGGGVTPVVAGLLGITTGITGR